MFVAAHHVYFASEEIALISHVIKNNPCSDSMKEIVIEVVLCKCCDNIPVSARSDEELVSTICAVNLCICQTGLSFWIHYVNMSRACRS